MYCENCGALRQAGNAFCVSCGASLAPADRPQGGAQPSFGYGATSTVETQDNPQANPLAVRLATFACWLAFASAAFWLVGVGDRLVYRHGEEFAWYLKNLDWWYCIPLLVTAGMLLARRGTPLIGTGFLVGTSVLLYTTVFDLGINLIEHSSTRYLTGPMSLNLIAAALAVGALGCVSLAVIQGKPKVSLPSAELVIVASLAGAFSALDLVLWAYGNHFWSFDLIYFDGPPMWIQILWTGLAVAIPISLAIGCMLGGRAAASVAIAGATYFGLLTIQTFSDDHRGLSLGFYFGVLACGAFIAMAVIASSIAKREMRPASLDPSLLAR